MALADTLKTDINAPIVKPSEKYRLEEIVPLQEMQVKAAEQEAEFERKKEIQKAESEAKTAKMMSDYDESAAEKLKNHPSYIKFQEAIDQKSKAAYIPDQENPRRLATILALTNLLGVAVGGKGKTAAQNALAAQNGMLEGYQKGRADIIKQQKDIFDENQKQLDKTIENLHKGFQDAVALAPLDRKAAEEKAMSIINQENADFVRELYNKSGLVATYKTITAMLKPKEERLKNMQQEEQKMVMTPYQKEMLDLKKRELSRKEQKDEGTIGALPKDAKTKDEYRARFEVIKNIEDLQDLLQNPKYSKFITPATKFTPDILANLQQNFPELQSKLARIQAQEFLIGGKSLTGSEQKILEPIFGWRGLTADALNRRLGETKRAMQVTQSLNEEIYPGFKNLKPKLDAAYESIGKIPTIPQQETPQAVYKVGQEITRGGKKYKVIDDSNPEDPDLEEIK
jgi:hypothetical protein